MRDAGVQSSASGHFSTEMLSVPFWSVGCGAVCQPTDNSVSSSSLLA